MTAPPASDPAERRRRADESVAARFSRVMNATTSPLGALTDPPLVAVATGVTLLAFLAVKQAGVAALVVPFAVLAAAPVAIALAAYVALARARRKVVDWLATLPFPIENMNAILNGLDEGLEVTFASEDARPSAADLNARLDRVHPDAFVTRHEPGEPFVEVRIGVVDSKRNPSGSNHRRYERLKAIVGEVLVPVSEAHPIVSVRVK